MSEIKRTLRALVANADMRILVGKVLSVDEVERTVEVAPLDGSATLFDIKLQAEMELENGFVLIPEHGSMVVVLLLNQTSGVVVSTSEIDKAELKIGQREMVFDSKGLMLKGSISNLSKDVSDLLAWNSKLTDALMAVVVTTPSGPGAFDPATIAKILELKVGLEPIKTQFKDYLNEP